MIDADLRKAIVALHERGMSIRAIHKKLGISRNSVRSILKSRGEVSLKPRKDQIALDHDLLRVLHTTCDGWKERMWEKLKDEHGIEIGYSTFTRKVRQLGVDQKPRSSRIPDRPGVEMQQDTSPYTIKISGRPTSVIACSLYYRFSKCLYLRFYLSFNRFRMKCFFHEALMYYRYVAPECIIDNTNLAVLRGTGKDAVMVPEMVEFARRYGFRFKAHEKGHSNRKAGEERGFWTIETNFLPGRKFASLEDLNAQAFTWATERIAKKPKKNGLIPAETFEYEKAFLTKVPDVLPPPYLRHERIVDQYGYVAFGANHYWVPSGIEGKVQILEYPSELAIMDGRREVARYPMAAAGVRGEVFPKERDHIPYQPRGRQKPTATEEAALRAISPDVSAYLDMALAGKGLSRHQLIRDLFALSRRLSPRLFEIVISRGLRFGVFNVQDLAEIGRAFVRDGADIVVPTVDVDESYAEREAYREGERTDDPDFATYQRLLEEPDDG